MSETPATYHVNSKASVDYRLTNVEADVATFNSSIDYLIKSVIEFRAEINARMDTIEAKMDTIEARMDTIEAKMDTIKEDVATLKDGVDYLIKHLVKEK